MTRDEADMLISRIPRTVSYGILKRASDLVSGDALIYKYDREFIEGADGARKKIVRGYCTACRTESILDYVAIGGCSRSGCSDSYGFIDPADGDVKITGRKCQCPNCGKNVETIREAAIGHARELGNSYFITSYKMNSIFMLLEWHIDRTVYRDGSIKINVYPEDGIIVDDKKVIGLRGYLNVYPYGKSYTGRWKRAGSSYEDFIGGLPSAKVWLDKKDLIGSTAEKSGIEDYLASCKTVYPGAYLWTWSKFKNLENLARTGCGCLLSSIFESCVVQITANGKFGYRMEGTKKYINWQRNRPCEMLGVDKADMPLVRKLTPSKLRFFKFVLKNYGIRLTEDMIRAIGAINLDNLERLLSPWDGEYHPNCIRTINYLIRSAKKDAIVTPTYLMDYWDSVKSVYGEYPAEIMYPKDLRRAHDEMLLRVSYKVDPEIDARIASRVDALTAYTLDDDNFIMTIPKSQEDFIKEGKILSHCVAKYANAHSKGDTSIFFLRRKNDPDMPYFTVEYRGGNVIQNHGFRNSNAPKDVSVFTNKWLKKARSIDYERTTAG